MNALALSFSVFVFASLAAGEKHSNGKALGASFEIDDAFMRKIDKSQFDRLFREHVSGSDFDSLFLRWACGRTFTV